MKETTLASQRAFTGRLLSVDVLDVELEPGVRSRREIVRHPGATAVLARRADGQFVLVRQFRKAVERVLTEIVAGGLEPGETPEQCAVREVREETGYAVRRLVALGPMVPAPGYTDEVIHLFYAELDPSPETQRTDHDERIVLDYVTEAELERLIATGQICDGKTLAAWTLYTLTRP